MNNHTRPIHHPISRNRFGAAVVLGLSLLMFSAAQADTIEMSVGDEDWNSDMWGGSVPDDTTAHDYFTKRLDAVNGPFDPDNRFRLAQLGEDSTFDGAAGSTITVVSGTMAFVKVENDETATLNGDMILDGGVLRYAGDDVGGDLPIGTLKVVNLSINSASTIEAPPDRDVFFTIDGTLTGSGNVNFLGDDGQSSEITVNAVSGYTGNSEVNSGLILESSEGR